ncbi:unnamed protein product [Colias eurytheme]|nr:unnamed protein product [Colias eurytheme]
MKQYNSALKSWWEFSVKNNFNFYEGNLSHVLLYLTERFETGAGYSSLNTTRSALALLLGPCTTSHDCISRLLKGAYRTNPPLPKYDSIWDTKIVLDYLSRYFPHDNISLQDLSFKTVTLIAIATAQRMQTLSYPGPAIQSKRKADRGSSNRGRRRKRVFRRPVPNSRLYRPAPPRPAPPPPRPRAAWPPPASSAPLALDTASRAALRLLSSRLASPPRAPAAPRPERRLVVKLPPAPESGHSASPERLVRARAMDTATRHSTSPDCSDGNEPSSAPSEFLAEFLSAIMRRQYAEALKYCRLILQYEPHNATARGFYPLLQHKLNNHKSNKDETSSSEEASPPHDLKNECDTEEGSGGLKVDGGAGATGGTGGTGGTGATGATGGDDSEDAWDESERSGASCSSLELDSSSPSRAQNSRSTRSSDSAWSRWESSGSRSERDDNGNELAAPLSPAPPAPHAPHPAAAAPLYCDGDIENDNAAGDSYPSTALKASSSAASSLRRLRAQFACSIK